MYFYDEFNYFIMNSKPQKGMNTKSEKNRIRSFYIADDVIVRKSAERRTRP